MHLSSQELWEKVADNARTTEDIERWEKAFRGPRTVVHRNEWTAEEEVTGCYACGRARGAAELHPEMVGYSQWRADRALWSAAEPAALAGYESAYEDLYPR